MTYIGFSFELKYVIGLVNYYCNDWQSYVRLYFKMSLHIVLGVNGYRTQMIVLVSLNPLSLGICKIRLPHFFLYWGEPIMYWYFLKERLKEVLFAQDKQYICITFHYYNHGNSSLLHMDMNNLKWRQEHIDSYTQQSGQIVGCAVLTNI